MTDRLKAVNLQLGLIAVSVQEPSTAEEHFSSIVESLKDNFLTARHINLYISALNQLGLVWSERLEPGKTKEHLLEASRAFKQYRELLSNEAPESITDLFQMVSVPRSKFRLLLLLLDSKSHLFFLNFRMNSRRKDLREAPPSRQCVMKSLPHMDNGKNWSSCTHTLSTTWHKFLKVSVCWSTVTLI